MTELEIPRRMLNRPRWGGHVVPFFTAWFLDGQLVKEGTPGAKPSFPTTDYVKLIFCRKHNMCWCCGYQMGSHKVFVIGPAGAIARRSYEPPSHLACARYAVQACPFLVDPDFEMRADHPNRKMRPGENKIENVAAHNPGISVLYKCRQYGFEVLDIARGTGVFVLDEPDSVEFWHRGRHATYKEVADGFQAAVKVNKMRLDPMLAFTVKHLLDFCEDAP